MELLIYCLLFSDKEHEDEQFYPAMNSLLDEESHTLGETSLGAGFPAPESSTSPRHTEATADQVRTLSGGILNTIVTLSFVTLDFFLNLSCLIKVIWSLQVVKAQKKFLFKVIFSTY